MFGESKKKTGPGTEHDMLLGKENLAVNELVRANNRIVEYYQREKEEEEKTPYWYEAWGPASGRCRHKHASYADAEACIKADEDAQDRTIFFVDESGDKPGVYTASIETHNHMKRLFHTGPIGPNTFLDEESE